MISGVNIIVLFEQSLSLRCCLAASSQSYGLFMKRGRNFSSLHENRNSSDMCGTRYLNLYGIFVTKGFRFCYLQFLKKNTKI